MQVTNPQQTNNSCGKINLKKINPGSPSAKNNQTRNRTLFYDTDNGQMDLLELKVYVPVIVTYTKKITYSLGAPYSQSRDKIPCMLTATFDCFEGTNFAYIESFCCNIRLQIYPYMLHRRKFCII